MPIKKAGLKAMRQDKKRKKRNQKVKNNIKELRTSFRKAIEAKDKKKAEEISKKLIKAYDKASQHKYIKKNTAARKKSQLMKKLNQLTKKG